MQQARAAQIVTVGDAACLVRLGSHPSPTTSRNVLALAAALDAASPPGLVDVIPAYTSVLVRFDPLVIEPAAMAAQLGTLLGKATSRAMPRGRLVRIPVCYGGDAGPDLDEVAQLLGLTPAEVIRRHTAATYRVAFLGFLAGYPYLTGLPAELAVPRLATPRTRVPAGSVAIAEHQAGIYPVESPGGWRILGRTSAQLFDPNHEPPSLLQPGDRVRFYASSGADRQSTTPAAGKRSISDTAATYAGMPWLRVVQPGIQTTIQDSGRQGYARYGVSMSGAADPDALALGNALLGNCADAAALEVTGGNASFEALAPGIMAVVGGTCAVRLNGRRVASDMTFALSAGDVLDIGAISAGMRVYICVVGGVAVPRVMGSRATDLRAGLGGLDGRPLRPGDVLHRGHDDTNTAGAAGCILPQDLTYRLPISGTWTLRILPGPQSEIAPGTLDALLRASFTVDARSDRVGVRLRRMDGPNLDGGQVVSEGLPRGAVQLPPDGEPVLLLADAQATGGYRVPAVVISADLWRIGQLRPGDSLRFRLISPDEALAALRHRASEIARVLSQPSPARLFGGFAEWSEDADLMLSERKEGKNDGQ